MDANDTIVPTIVARYLFKDQNAILGEKHFIQTKYVPIIPD